MSERFPIWVERAQALPLALGSLYLLAIGRLSPHPLPGLGWLGVSVFAAGLAVALRTTRLKRAALTLGLLTVAFGLLGVGDIANQGAHARHAQLARAPSPVSR
jgi:hypothetical protein